MYMHVLYRGGVWVLGWQSNSQKALPHQRATSNGVVNRAGVNSDF